MIICEALRWRGNKLSGRDDDWNPSTTMFSSRVLELYGLRTAMGEFDTRLLAGLWCQPQLQPDCLSEVPTV